VVRLGHDRSNGDQLVTKNIGGQRTQVDLLALTDMLERRGLSARPDR
jgi:hypothetical protein